LLYFPAMQGLDLLAIAPHRDDAELSCGGTLLVAKKQGYRTGILDLSLGEKGSRGSAALRGAEADRAAGILGVSVRENLELPDAGITNTPDTRIKVARMIKKLQPKVVIAPAMRGKHPDHTATAQLIVDACFVAGLAKVDPATPPFRPSKVIHTIAYREDHVKPTFVVDITDVFEQKLEAIKCYGSQFDKAIQAGEVFPNGEALYDIVRHQAAHYGSLIRVQYGEPYWTSETVMIKDVVMMGVATF
jgi:bacillithiol biosynthesis deacetylase BshB1